MEFLSIFNDVMGPVMRGPSSSHTAGAYRIGKMARCLLNDEPVAARVTFDPAGSYAPTYRALGVDLAFACGVMGRSMLDEEYHLSLRRAEVLDCDIRFEIAPVGQSSHPNAVRILLFSRKGKRLDAVAEAVGGGGVRFVQLDGWPVSLNGKSYEILIATSRQGELAARKILEEAEVVVQEAVARSGDVLLHAESTFPFESARRSRMESLPGVRAVWTADPVFYVRRGEAAFSSVAQMIRSAEDRGSSLGAIAAAYESALLGRTHEWVMEEMLRRYEVMKISVHHGLDDRRVRMLLLEPAARGIFEGETGGRLALGGPHTRAAARAMAVMHVCNSGGIVCAAPTGGSAGVIPGVLVTLEEEWDLSGERMAGALFAASAVGLMVCEQATFAAELAGCQVEIGAAGAMAAAAVVEAAGGTARQAADAAAIALQNTMGSVCDPVAGACEIPCHTRNAVAASSAFVCADLVLGGYRNPIPLDETIAASYAVGSALPRELRCTAEGGLAITPSAKRLPRLR